MERGGLWWGGGGSARRLGLSTLVAGSGLLWLVSVVKRDVSIVDSFWSLGFMLLSWVYSVHPETSKGNPKRKALILSTVSLWAVRLSAYLTWRNHGVGEAQLPEENQPNNDEEKRKGKATEQERRKTLWEGSHLGMLDYCGAFLWFVGFIFESVSDFQLARFKADPSNRGKLLNTGLWRYSRHPNYFGNATMFWGFYLMACSVRRGWATFFSPALMNYLLLKVSGVAMLEYSLKKKKPGYSHYQNSTNAFLPWFPRTK
ncbi:Steroid 5-alpha reductase family enzyme [Balamuthia mandrillaris]